MERIIITTMGIKKPPLVLVPRECPVAVHMASSVPMHPVGGGLQMIYNLLVVYYHENSNAGEECDQEDIFYKRVVSPRSKGDHR